MTTAMATGTPLDLDGLTMDAIRDGLLRDRPVTVLGFARSGISLVRFLVDAGARVTVYDGRPESELADAVGQLEGRPIGLLAGPDVDPAEAWQDAALVTTSPSINPDYPTTEPRLREALQTLVAARAAGDSPAPALVSEADVFLRLCPAPTVGVTGTKGKTTTSSLIAAILDGDPAHPAVLGGNIGVPLIERLPELTPDHRVVIELSELQLPTLSRGTTVAVYTNVTSDHLDRHGSLEGYRAAKRRLAELVDPAGALVLNAEDPVVAEYATLGTARTVPYRRGTPPDGGVGVAAVEDPWIVARNVRPLGLAGAEPTAGGVAPVPTDGRIMPLADLRIPGWHSISNALAAVAVGLLFGVASDAIRRAAGEFRGVEHRLEEVDIVDGVRFVNDSQGTQPDAVIAAIQAFRQPIVLIAGGRDKGVDLSELARQVAQWTNAVVLIGESGPALGELIRAAGHERIESAASLEAAVERADAIARELLAASPAGAHATVLLSPAAASFDMFVDYAARGRAFKAAVADLASKRRERRSS